MAKFLAQANTHTSWRQQKFIIARRIILINYAEAKYALLSKVCHEFCAIFWVVSFLCFFFCSWFIGDKDRRGYRFPPLALF